MASVHDLGFFTCIDQSNLQLQIAGRLLCTALLFLFACVSAALICKIKKRSECEYSY